MNNIVLITFWVSVALIFYTYIGFPILLFIRAKLFAKPINKAPITPRVSLIIAAYNEAEVIEKKMQNVLSIDYPADKLEIIVASDGSSDDTVKILKPFDEQGKIKLLDLPRQGKNQTLNTAIKYATGEILAFSDADATLELNALRNLVAPFNDPDVGGVGGDFRYTSGDISSGGERSYWNIDRQFKIWQSLAGSMNGVTGQLFAIRKTLFHEMPLDTADDFYISNQVPSSHLRLVFEPSAIASGSIAESSKEFKRKVRIAVRGFTGLTHMNHLLNPSKYGFYSLQIFSHKVLRRIAVLPLLAAAITTPLLYNSGMFYRVIFVLQIIFHGLALAGFMLRDQPLGKNRLLNLPYYFHMVYTAMLLAIVYFIRGKKFAVWIPPRPDLPNAAQSKQE